MGLIKRCKILLQTNEQRRVLHSGLLHSGLLHSGLLHSGLLHSGLLYSGLLHSGLLYSGLLYSGPLALGPLALGPLALGPSCTWALRHWALLHLGLASLGPLALGPCVIGPSCTRASCTWPLLSISLGVVSHAITQLFGKQTGSKWRATAATAFQLNALDYATLWMRAWGCRERTSTGFCTHSLHARVTIVCCKVQNTRFRKARRKVEVGGSKWKGGRDGGSGEVWRSNGARRTRFRRFRARHPRTERPKRPSSTDV